MTRKTYKTYKVGYDAKVTKPFITEHNFLVVLGILFIIIMLFKLIVAPYRTYEQGLCDGHYGVGICDSNGEVKLENINKIRREAK